MNRFNLFNLKDSRDNRSASTEFLLLSGNMKKFNIFNIKKFTIIAIQYLQLGCQHRSKLNNMIKIHLRNSVIIAALIFLAATPIPAGAQYLQLNRASLMRLNEILSELKILLQELSELGFSPQNMSETSEISDDADLEETQLIGESELPDCGSLDAVNNEDGTCTLRIEAHQGDAEIGRRDSTWAEAKNISYGETIYSSDAANRVSALYSSRSEIKRSFFSFDTSQLPDSATITDAAFNFYVTLLAPSSDNVINLYEGRQSNPESLTLNDYGSCPNPQPNSEDLLSQVNLNQTDHYNKWVIMALSDQNIINKTGYTSLCLRQSSDGSGNPVVGNYEVHVRTANSQEKPFLEISYRP